VTQLAGAKFANPPLAGQVWARLIIPATAAPAEIQAEVRAIHEK
jgi:hypothetical protein